MHATPLHNSLTCKHKHVETFSFRLINDVSISSLIFSYLIQRNTRILFRNKQRSLTIEPGYIFYLRNATEQKAIFRWHWRSFQPQHAASFHKKIIILLWINNLMTSYLNSIACPWIIKPIKNNLKLISVGG